MQMSVRAVVLTLAVILAVGPWLEAQDKGAAEPSLKVELVSTGTGARKELRFKPKVGSKQKMTMTMAMTQEVSVDGNKLPVPGLPGQQFTIDFEIKEVASNGDVTYGFKFSEVKLLQDEGANPAAVAAMNAMLKPMMGATGTGQVTNRGLTKSAKFDLPENAPAQLKSMIDSMKDSINRISTPLPAEAVGVGAQWKVTQDLNSGGIQMTQTSTHELKSISDDGFDVAIKIEQAAGEQEVQAAMMPIGSKMKLNSMKSSGEGTSSMVFAALNPKKSQVKVLSDASMRMTIGGNEQAMEFSTTMEMSVEAP